MKRRLEYALYFLTPIAIGFVVWQSLQFLQEVDALRATVAAYEQKYPAPPSTHPRQVYLRAGEINGYRVFVLFEESGR